MDQIIAENRMPPNPVHTKVLTNIMLGAPQSVYHGGLLRATVRYFDPDNGRPGVPSDVATLVDEIKANRVGLQLVNLSRSETKRVVVQAGAFGEHNFTDAQYGDGDSTQTKTVGGKHFTVELPPSTTIRIGAGMQRFLNDPSYAFPWHDLS